MTNTDHLARIFDLADARNVEAGHMIMTYGDNGDDPELGDIIREDFGVEHITDSVIDDILAELDDEHAYCNHAEGHCEAGDFDDEEM